MYDRDCVDNIAKNCNLVTREHLSKSDSSKFLTHFGENRIYLLFSRNCFYWLVRLCVFLYIYRSTEGIRDNLRFESFNCLRIRRKIFRSLLFLISESRDVSFKFLFLSIIYYIFHRRKMYLLLNNNNYQSFKLKTYNDYKECLRTIIFIVLLDKNEPSNMKVCFEILFFFYRYKICQILLPNTIYPLYTQSRECLG